MTPAGPIDDADLVYSGAVRQAALVAAGEVSAPRVALAARARRATVFGRTGREVGPPG